MIDGGVSLAYRRNRRRRDPLKAVIGPAMRRRSMTFPDVRQYTILTAGAARVAARILTL